ncbi:MAG: AI-2E family transporter [Deltaproteobacteria bacterium]|nr:AI-2E family transporter [Deltaproteobacteria bacterium]
MSLLTVVLWGVAEARPFLVPLSIAALLAFLISPVVAVLRRLRVPEWLAIGVGALMLVLPLLGLGYLMFAQTQALARDFPGIVVSVKGMLDRFGVARHFNVDNLVARAVSSAGEGVQLLLSGLGAVLNAGSQAALILLFSILMLASRIQLRTSAERILARNESIRAAAMLDAMTHLVSRFLFARFAIVLIIGGADFIVLAAFGVNYAPLLAAFLGVMTSVPMIGFVISVIPPIAVALAMHKSLAALVGMFGALIAMSAIEGNVLTPKFVGKQINLNALSAFVGLFAGGLLWGLWGMLLASPILGILRIVFMASPRLQPWGELLADRTADDGLVTRLRARRPRPPRPTTSPRPPQSPRAGHA